MGVSEKLIPMSANIYLFSTTSHKDAISINPLEITFLQPDIDFSKYDYFILTSKQASLALTQYNQQSLKPALCISQATAKSYKDIKGEVLEIGEGYGDTLSAMIMKYPSSTKWLYVRAKVVASDFVEELQEKGFDIDEAILYESECSKNLQNLQIEEDATLIFTSPSSVKCFLTFNTMSSKAKIIVIGKSTAKALPKNIEYIISEQTSIQSCIDLIKL